MPGYFAWVAAAVLHLAVTVEVSVIDVDSNGVDGAIVQAADSGGDIQSAKATTDAQGKCQLTLPDDIEGVELFVRVPADDSGIQRFKSKTVKVKSTTVMVVLEAERSLSSTPTLSAWKGWPLPKQLVYNGVLYRSIWLRDTPFIDSFGRQWIYREYAPWEPVLSIGATREAHSFAPVRCECLSPY